jgi:O-antigen/teichoic acid export membrane protein
VRAASRKIAEGFAVQTPLLQGMSRNFYILGASLGLFALLSGALSLLPSSFQPGLPANGTLWRTLSLILLLAGLGSVLVGMMSALFEQVDRRSEEGRRSARRRRRSEKN